MHTRSIDFTLTFPRANTDTTICIELPFEFESPVEGGVDLLVKYIEEYFTMTDEGPLWNYLGVKLERNQGSINLYQPFLIRRILDTVGGMENANA